MFLAQNISLQQRGRHRNITIFVAMEQNRSDLFCSRVEGTFYLLYATFFFNWKNIMTMGHENFFRCACNGAMLHCMCMEKALVTP